MTGLKLTGFKEMDAVLRSLPTSTAKRVADRAMKAAMEPVAAAANGMRPKGKTAVIVNKKLNKNQSREFRGKESETVRVMFVGSPSPRAHLEEFGTGPRFHKSGKYVGIMRARPFMRPAWDATRQQVLDRLAADLGREIEKTVARRARRAAKG
jgi:HK97 gp10 family phage protein